MGKGSFSKQQSGLEKSSFLKLLSISAIAANTGAPGLLSWFRQRLLDEWTNRTERSLLSLQTPRLPSSVVLPPRPSSPPSLPITSISLHDAPKKHDVFWHRFSAPPCRWDAEGHEACKSEKAPRTRQKKEVCQEPRKTTATQRRNGGKK